MRNRVCFIGIAVVTLVLVACSPQAEPAATQLPATTATSSPPATVTASPTPPPSATPSSTPTFTPIPPTQTSTRPPATDTPEQADSGDRVSISGFRFGPNVLEVKVGTRVTWINRDSTSHTVSSDDGVFESGALDQNDSFSFTFTEAGTFAYHCGFHIGMNGTIRVVP
jgi:plastocyanin